MQNLSAFMSRDWKFWDSSWKSHKPLYSKLENYPETRGKSPTSILRLLPSYTSKKVVSGESSQGRAFFYLVNIVKKPYY